MKRILQHSLDAQCDKCKGFCKQAVIAKPEALNISASDWEEIYACLSFKLQNVKAGKYRLRCSDGFSKRVEDKEQRRWVTDLRRLLNEIGIDGKRARQITGAL